MKHGDRGKEYVLILGCKEVVAVNETTYDASYDEFCEQIIIVNQNPTSKDLFKAKLMSGK